MTHAIFDTVDNKVAKDQNGHFHIYSSKEAADRARAMYLNEPRYVVKPF